MKRIYLCILVGLGCSAHAASIAGLHHKMSSPGQYEIVFERAGSLPRHFVTHNPERLVLDFADTDLAISQRNLDIASYGIDKVDVIAGQDRTRAVINLDSTLPYKLLKRDKDVVVVFDVGVPNKIVPSAGKLNAEGKKVQNQLFDRVTLPSNAGATVSTVLPEPTIPAPTIKAQTTAPNKIEKVQLPSIEPASALSSVEPALPAFVPTFTADKSGAGKFAFVIPQSVRDVSVRQDGNKIVAFLDSFYVSKNDQKRMEVQSYGTPVSYVDIFRRSRGTEIVLSVKRSEAYELSSYRDNDTYVIDVKPVSEDNSLQDQIDQLQGFGPGKRYQGAPLSLNFQDIEVRAVLQIIAEFTNNNIVVSDAVSGNITLRLDSVPWDQALDIILKTKGLGMRENGSVIYIAPASELDQRELDALKIIQERDQLVPARTELIQIKYANAADLANILERSRQGIGTGDRESYSRDSILSSKGTVSVDQRTNTLLVSDIPSKLQAVRDLVARLDEPVRQVLVDARLVLTRDNFTRDLGARFGLSFVNSQGNGRYITGSGNAEAAHGYGVNYNNHLASIAKNKDSTLEFPALSDRLGVNMPVAGGSYGLAILAADFLVDLELSALQTEGKAEIVSSPRVVTQDGKKARIASGQQIPYETVSEKGSQVEFKNAELSLDVTPRIAPDNRIDLLLDVKNDKPDSSLRSTAGNVGLSTNQVETNVLVDNGETIVLGGVYQQEQSLSTDKVPLLGDLPVIGNAFKKTNKRFNKSELLIFVTPRIIDNRLSDYDKFSNLRN